MANAQVSPELAEHLEDSGRLQLLRTSQSDEEQEPPYGQDIVGQDRGRAAEALETSRISRTSSLLSAKESLGSATSPVGLSGQVQERARSWGRSVTQALQADMATGSTEGETELVPDYGSMPLDPGLRQMTLEDAGVGPQLVEQERVKTSTSLEGMMVQRLQAQAHIMERLGDLEAERKQRLEFDRQTVLEMARRQQVETERKAALELERGTAEADRRRQLEDGRRRSEDQRRQLEAASLFHQELEVARQEVADLTLQDGSLALVETVNLASSRGVSHNNVQDSQRTPVDQSLEKEAPRSVMAQGSSANVRAVVGSLKSVCEHITGGNRQGSAEGSTGVRDYTQGHSHINEPPSAGSVFLHGKKYSWHVTTEGLQLAPCDDEIPEEPLEPHSTTNIFTSRARSPFVRVDPNVDPRNLMQRTPSPSRNRGGRGSWSDRRRSVSRSPNRSNPMSPKTAPGRLALGNSLMLRRMGCLRVHLQGCGPGLGLRG